MFITINNYNIELKYSFRAMMIYEKITGESFNPKGITELMIYLYSIILASSKDITLSFDDFMNWIDDNPTVLNEFTVWLTSIINKNKVFSDKEETDTVDEDTVLKKK